MARLNLKFEADKSEFNRGFNKLENTLDDFSPVWKEVQTEFYKIEREQFDSEGRAGESGKFKPLSPAYERVKQAKFGSVPILTASGRLYKSLTSETSDSVVITNKQDAAFGTNLPYAQAHQKGARNLPQRKPIDISSKQQNRLLRTIKKSLLPYLRQTGLKVSE